MAIPTERNQAIFINPDLAGLHAAYFAHRAGASVCVINESRPIPVDTLLPPKSFPSSGTFFPKDFDSIVTQAGFPPYVWEREPKIRIQVIDKIVELNSDDGAGGFILALNNLVSDFRGREIISSWMQDILGETDKILSRDVVQCSSFRPVYQSVSDSFCELNIPDSDNVLALIDTISILIAGRGAAQTDMRDFPIVLAGFINGWHVPVRSEKDLAQILKNRLRNEGVRWHDVESVESVMLHGRQIILNCAQLSPISTDVLIVSEDDRFHHPSQNIPSGTIAWVSLQAEIDRLSGSFDLTGAIHYDISRPPVNDNFITFREGGDNVGRLTISVPLEERYRVSLSKSRTSPLKSRIRSLLMFCLDCDIEEIIYDELVRSVKPDIALPGAGKTLTYPGAPRWGEDLLARLRLAEKISREIISLLK